MPETGARLTYGQLQRALDDAISLMRGLGIENGDRVALTAANGPALILAFLAVTECGAAAAPLNPALGQREVRAELTDLQVSRLFYEAPEGGASNAIAAAGTAGVPAIPMSLEDGALTVAAETRPTPFGPADSSSIALLLHTSGTTSRPKTVPIRQRNLVASTRAVIDTYGLSESDTSMCVMPLFHVHGLVAAGLATLGTGGSVVVPARFRASSFWDDVVRHRAMWYTAVPTIHSLVLERAVQAPGLPAHGLRFVRSCSAPLPAVIWMRYEEAIRAPLLEAYGMTEAAHQMASNPLPPEERRPGTVGHATGVELAILDDDWRAVAEGERGEVAVRGASVVDGYLDNPEANVASFRDRWFRTGDVGSLSSDGYLTLVGRVKELINRGGEKISPYEIEDVLLTHPAVREAAAYPVPDKKYGEQVGVVVVPKGEVEGSELIRYCRGRLADFKVPIRVTILSEIPKGPTGKVQRLTLSALVD